MATPAKRSRFSDNDSAIIVGFLHGVSPLKLSKKNYCYFEATLQTGQQEFRRLVCFSTDKRASCMQASENKLGVKLIDCRKAISNADGGNYDVLLTSRSRVEAADSLPFGYREPCFTTKKSIAEVLGMRPRQKVGSIDVKVLQALSSRMVALNTEQIEVKEFSVCDLSGQTCLSVWGAHITSVKEEHSYRFHNLATRKNMDTTVLTTTPSTTIANVAAVGEPVSMGPLSPRVEETVQGQVSAVQIVAKPRCRRCHGNQDSMATKSNFHRCQNCLLLQLTPSYAITYSGVLIIQQLDGTEFSGTLTNSAVCKYVQNNGLSASSHDGSFLEEHIIGQGKVEVISNGEGLVLQVSAVAPEEPGQPMVEEQGADDLCLEELLDNDFSNDPTLEG